MPASDVHDGHMTTRAQRLANQPYVIDISAGVANAIRVYPTGRVDDDFVEYRETPDGDAVFSHHSGLDFAI
jgi:hypothetical protein